MYASQLLFDIWRRYGERCWADRAAGVVVVPFLPLEREHVKMCIRFNASKKRRRPSEALVDRIADEFEYVPTDAEVYSSSGCKRVDEKVNLYTIQTF